MHFGRAQIANSQIQQVDKALMTIIHLNKIYNTKYNKNTQYIVSTTNIIETINFSSVSKNVIIFLSLHLK